MTPLAGIPLLEHTIARARGVASAEVVIVATSREPSDDPVAEHCSTLGVAVHRGPLRDVASRMLQAARAVGAETIARVSADSPFIDPAIVERAIGLFEEGGADVVTNVQPRSFPVGQSVEVFSANTLEGILGDDRPLAEREHVTTALYANPDRYVVRNFERTPNLSHLRLVVDTPDDLRRMEALAGLLPEVPTDLPLDEIVRLAEQL
jgi:spore coat polysaccharide biosynthesis protein SpsF